MKLGLLLLLSLSACAVASRDPFGEGNDPRDAQPARADGGASNDAATQGDGGSQAPITRVACGGSFCRADQQCVSNECVQPCTGAKVPGDYATIQAALTALGPQMKDATICLSGQAYAESASASSSYGKALTILGPPAARINSLTVSGNFSKVSIRGFAAGTLSLSSQSPIDVTGMKVDTVTISAAQTGALVIDGCNIGGAGAYGVQLSRSSASTPAQITIQNSWIHDATSYGLYLYAYGSGATNVTLVNNTIQNNGTGIYSYSGVTLTFVNNIIMGSKTGISQQAQTAAFANNLLWSNQSNYAGYATDGAGYVKSDPLLDGDVPPSPKMGSPARGAADLARAPSTDYWGGPRSAADIGAVQGQ